MSTVFEASYEELKRLEAEVAKLTKWVKRVAKQPKSAELDNEDGDAFQYAYDTFIDEARALMGS